VTQTLTHIAGANAEHNRLHNRRVVLGQIRSAGKMGRAELARACGLSVQAVSNIIAGLQTEGLLRESGRLSNGRGLPTPQFTLNAAGAHAIGFEVRPNAVSAVLLDLEGNTRASVRESLNTTTPMGVASQLRAIKCGMLSTARLNESALLGAGVVMPGPFIQTGLANTSSTLPDWQGVDPQTWFEEQLQIPVVVENDANAAAMAERVSGCARSLRSYAFIYFGTGLGLGLVHEGSIYAGASGNAGEIGHILVPLTAQRSPVVEMVALESIASRLALNERLQQAGITAATVDAIERLHQQHNPQIHQWLSEAGPALSYAIHVIENLFDPESVVLGGALPDCLLTALINSLHLSDRSVANRNNRPHPRLMQGRSGRNTAALGGAALVINRTFTPHQTAASA